MNAARLVKAKSLQIQIVVGQSMVDQLGVYYDLRYRQYYKRSRFLAGLSSYNDDEIVEKIETETLQLIKEHQELIGNNMTMLGQKKLESDPIIKLFQKRFSHLSIREQVICEMIVSEKWDRGVADYCEVVTGVIAYYMQLFFDLNHLQDIIQGLAHKGIVFPKLGQDEIGEEKLKTKPFIYLTLSPELEEEGLKIISGGNNFLQSLVLIIFSLLPLFFHNRS